MTKYTLLVIVGFLLMVTPFWGTPRDITIAIIQIAGLLLVVLGIISTLPRRKKEESLQNG
jgi:VIT1/CCC1 family predicted Fe2+/Mn2+ transporter